MNIVITGGCGFLGQHLVDALKHEHSITILDKHPRPIEGAEIRQADIVKDNLHDYFAGTDLVIHAAALVTFGRKEKNALYSVNVTGTYNVVEASKHVPWFIHISSVAALGYSNNKHKPITETHTFDWNTATNKHYMHSKKLADELIQRNAVIVYPGLIYGPGDTTNTAAIINAINERQLPFNAPGGTTVIDVRDVVNGITQIIRQNKRTGKYILTHHNLTYKEINTTIAEQLDVRPPRYTLSPMFRIPLHALGGIIETTTKGKLTKDHVHSSFLYRYFDNTKARTELEWEPIIPFEQTIKDSIHWMREHGLEK